MCRLNDAIPSRFGHAWLDLALLDWNLRRHGDEESLRLPLDSSQAVCFLRVSCELRDWPSGLATDWIKKRVHDTSSWIKNANALTPLFSYSVVRYSKGQTCERRNMAGWWFGLSLRAGGNSVTMSPSISCPRSSSVVSMWSTGVESVTPRAIHQR